MQGFHTFGISILQVVSRLELKQHAQAAWLATIFVSTLVQGHDVSYFHLSEDSILQFF